MQKSGGQNHAGLLYFMILPAMILSLANILGALGGLFP
jgi:hypothetical protein